ncbi:MAG: SRPBCC domain-containing protein, partial [Acidimicrobiales bacterium]
AHPDQVWAALTRPELTARYLWGLAAESTWEPGAALCLGSADARHHVEGQVLRAERSQRLSYSLSAGDAHPSTFVTWEIIATDCSARVRLTVDETQTESERDEEGERIWRSVAEALTHLLADPTHLRSEA